MKSTIVETVLIMAVESNSISWRNYDIALSLLLMLNQKPVLLTKNILAATVFSHRTHKKEKFIPYLHALQSLTLTVLVATIDEQWEGMGDVGLVRYEPALLPPCPTVRVLSYSN